VVKHQQDFLSFSHHQIYGIVRMAGRDSESQQTNRFSGHSEYGPPVQRQQHSRLQHSAEILPAWGNGQLEGEWEGEPLAAMNGGVVQGTLQGPHHFNAENYDTVNYPPSPGDPAMQYTYPNGSFIQRTREYEQVIFPVCSDLSSRIYPCLNLRRRRINKMTSLAMLLLPLSQAPTKSRFRMH